MSDEPSLTRRGAATRERLLLAAEAELGAREGALEVAAVAARAEVSVGLLYRYFGSKAGLVAAVVDDFYDRLHAQVADFDPAPQADWAARERKRLELSVEFHYAEPLAGVILSRLFREPEVAAVEVRRMGRLVEDAARNVTAGQRRGELPADLDPRTVGALMIGSFRVAMGEALSRPRRPDAEVFVEQLWRFIVGGVRFTSPA
ncbi:MAG: TetR/AcrR family transcriptional regulator [Solirubrobacterales bacterium]|nr:TetR/AcrR family transcriptional regulator [Solirubrobacterales bacterium]